MALSLEVGAVMHTHSNFSEQEMEAHRVVNSYQGGGSGQWQAGGSSRRVAVAGGWQLRWRLPHPPRHQAAAAMTKPFPSQGFF